MDCKTARLLLHFTRPHGQDLAADEADELAGHLADCLDCRQLRDAEHAIDDRLGPAMRHVPIPGGLRERILTRVASQRDSWYRRRLIRIAGAAAAAVAITWAGWLLWPRSFVRLDLETARQEANSRLTVDQLQESFARKGIRVQLPTKLNYALLTHHGFKELQGQRVPVMEFKRGAAFLRVYVLDGRTFDLNDLEQNGDGPSGRVTIKWWGRSTNREFGYVVEYMGGTPDDFEPPPPSAT